MGNLSSVETRYFNPTIRTQVDTVLPDATSPTSPSVAVFNTSSQFPVGTVIGFGGDGIVIVRGIASQTIDGLPTKVLSAGESALFVSDGVGWRSLPYQSTINQGVRIGAEAGFQSTASGAWSQLTWLPPNGTVRFNFDGMFNNIDQDRFIVRTAGRYLIGMNFAFAANITGGVRGGRILRNRFTSPPGQIIAMDLRPPVSDPATATVILMNTIWDAAAGDHFTFEVFQDSGGVLNIIPVADFSREFWMHRLS